MFTTETAARVVLDVSEPEPFELDITLIEASDAGSYLLAASDDGCGATCPTSCVSKLDA